MTSGSEHIDSENVFACDLPTFRLLDRRFSDAPECLPRLTPSLLRPMRYHQMGNMGGVILLSSLARQFPRIHPRGARSVGAPMVTPLQKQNSSDLGHCFLGEGPVLRMKQKRRKYEKNDLGQTPDKYRDPVTSKFKPRGLQRSPSGPIYSLLKIHPTQNRKLDGFCPLFFQKGLNYKKEEKSKRKTFLSVLEGPFQA